MSMYEGVEQLRQILGGEILTERDASAYAGLAYCADCGEI